MKDIEIEIITIGDELLIGQVVDTNSAWMARELNKEGFRVKQITTVSDEEQHILDSIETAFHRADVVLITGGLGPTKDDITKQTLCTYFNTELVFDPTVIDTINELFKDRPIVINELTYNLAYVPKAATIIQNKRGTAPVTWFEKDGNILVSMPGVPSEMQWVMSNEILPRLKTNFNTPTLMHQSVLVFGIPESALAIKLTDWENNLSADIKLAYLPSAGLVKLRLTGDRDNRDSLAADIQSTLVSLRNILGSAILAEVDAPVEARNRHLTQGKGLDSFYGRKLHRGQHRPPADHHSREARVILPVPWVAYENSVKTGLLGVFIRNTETRRSRQSGCSRANGPKAFGNG